MEKDMAKAIEWYQKAAEARNSYSMFALGNAYEHGEGVDRDEEKAMEWYQRAAEAGSAERQAAEKWLATEAPLWVRN